MEWGRPASAPCARISNESGEAKHRNRKTSRKFRPSRLQRFPGFHPQSLRSSRHRHRPRTFLSSSHPHLPHRSFEQHRFNRVVGNIKTKYVSFCHFVLLLLLPGGNRQIGANDSLDRMIIDTRGAGRNSGGAADGSGYRYYTRITVN